MTITWVVPQFLIVCELTSDLDGHWCVTWACVGTIVSQAIRSYQVISWDPVRNNNIYLHHSQGYLDHSTLYILIEYVCIKQTLLQYINDVSIKMKLISCTSCMINRNYQSSSIFSLQMLHMLICVHDYTSYVMTTPFCTHGPLVPSNNAGHK